MINNVLIVSKNNNNKKIDAFLFKMFPTLSRSLILSFIRKRKIRINGKRITKRNYVLKENDIIKYYFFPEFKAEKKIKGNIAIEKKNIFFEDNKILVVYKNPNVVMHSHPSSLNNLVYCYLLNKNEKIFDQAFQIHHINRLDKHAQGLVIYGKNKIVQDFLYNEFLNKRVEKKYYCVIENKNNFPMMQKIILKGYIKYKNGIFFELLSNEEDRHSKYAEITIMNIGKIEKDLTLLRVFSKTGRKHQIRILLSENKTPILNDYKYSPQKKHFNKPLFLFAYYLSFSKRINKNILNQYTFEVEKQFIIRKIRYMLANKNSL